MSKKNKKNQKKVHAKINNTPVKTEGAKKEESKAPTKEELKAKKKAEKKAKEEKKYAASKARIEARKARKASHAEKLAGIKKEKSTEPVKLTLEQRKERQENRRKIAYNRHISSIRRRCKRMKLTDEQTQVVVNNAKAEWDKAKAYNLTIVYDSCEGKKEELVKLVKDTGIRSACITGSTAFFKDVPKDSVDKIRELLPGATIYQYRSDKNESLFKDYEHKKTKTSSKNGKSHSRECSKSRNVNFYNLRRLKKAEKKKMEEAAKPVNKKPTQVKEIKPKSVKKAA